MLNRFRMLVACALTFALCWVPGFAFAGDAEDGAQVAATAHGLSYGIERFERLAKGTARAMEGQPEGYRFPVDEDVDLVVVPAADRVVVWISPKAVERYGLDPQDNECVSGLKALVCELDSANCMGGAQLGTWIFLGMSRRKQRLKLAGIPMALTSALRMGTAMW